SEAQRPDRPRPAARRRRRASRPSGPGESPRPASGHGGDSGPRRQNDQSGQDSPRRQKPRNGQSGQNQGGREGQAGQKSRGGQGSQGGGPEQKKQPQSGAGRPGQRRRRRRGGRGRRGQGRNPQAQQRAPENESIGQGQSVRTVRSTDGAAGATSSGGQVPRHGRGRPAAKSGAKPGNAGKNAGSGKNARGGRGNNRHQRGGQRLRTVLETSAGGLVIRGLLEAAATPEPDLSRLEVALIGRLDRRNRMLWSMPK